MSIRKYIIFATSVVLALCVLPSGVFAKTNTKTNTNTVVITASEKKIVILAAADTPKPVMKTSVLPETSASGSEEETPQIMAERQKTYDTMNTLLIQSYKTKLDKILSDVYVSVENVAKEDPAPHAAILEKIAEEIDKKMESMEKQGISPNRKKILVSIFTYLKSDILMKAEDLKQKGK